MNGDWLVGQVAHLANVSVRTLHHYDEIGLLSPSQRTPAGHRRYDAADLQRLRTILFYREMDFGLDEIASMLADPGSGTDEHLRHQHRMLRERIRRHGQLLEALEKEMESRQMGISLSPEEQFEMFGSDKFGGEYADEAQQRWGDTPEWAESQRRTAAYTKDDWREIKAEDDANRQAFADALAAGTPADADAVTDLAEAHRQHIGRWFYECGLTMHRCLGDMYVADERFRATYDAVRPGLAEYVRDAIAANAERRGLR